MIGRDVETLALENPAEYQRLLESYHLLLGEHKLWWQCYAAAEIKGWPSCVRNAIAEAALRLGLPARSLAVWLDHGYSPGVRAAVIASAHERLRA